MSSTAKQKKNKKPKQITAVASHVGRPSDYDSKYCQMLIDHMAKVYSFESFGGLIGVSKQTLYDWRKKYKEFLDAHNVGKSKVQLGVEKMFKAQATGQMKGSPASLIFWAKNITTMRDEPVDLDEGYEEMDFIE